MCRQHLRGRKSLLRQKRFYPKRGAWSGCPIRGRKMISRTWCTVPKSKVPSEGQPAWKVGHSALQKVINLLFFTSTDRLCSRLKIRKIVSHKGQRSGSLLPHDYRIEHRRQDEHTESSDNASTHKDAMNRGDKPQPRTQC